MRETNGTVTGPRAPRAQRSSFWRRALTLAGLACAVLAGLAAPAVAQSRPSSKLTAEISKSRPDTLILAWRGSIELTMANQIKQAFETNRRQTKRVVLTFTSGGGSVAEGERVIKVLRDIKRTHTLETVIAQGGTCQSMCLFMYVQGDVRRAGLTSVWLFHEVSVSDPKTKKITKLIRGDWLRLVTQYVEPAGVSKAWIDSVKQQVNRTDFYQTGADLVQAKSGIITHALGNRIERKE